MIRKNLRRDQPIAWLLAGMKVCELDSTTRRGRNLPGRLVIPPGVYRVHGRNYHLRREGLYRFIYPLKDNQQRIVWDGHNPRALMSALAWIVTHGNRDERLEFRELCRKALRHKLILTCGPVSSFAHQLCGELGVRSRLAEASTLGTLNNYNCGHCLMEIHMGGRWVLVDLDQNCMFRRRGKYLSLLELTERAASDDYELVPIAAAVRVDVNGWQMGAPQGFHWDLYADTNLYDEHSRRRWYRRIMMLPRIDGVSTAMGQARHARAIAIHPKINLLSRAEFIRRFYGDGRRSRH
ncbi:MAG: hypothetical protein PHW60_12255 [Kiritimatiellae bacterium]|nr:hypothetical protein [Kiritimatiellia bacterium]